MVADGAPSAAADAFDGRRAGEERVISGVRCAWCPPGRYLMGSPPDEPERRPGEDQVEVTLSSGFWVARYETTQGEWRRILGPLPRTPTAGAGDEFPAYDVNYAEVERYCAELTARARAAGDLPAGWEFRLPTEAQWEYACRAGTTTATVFGASLSSRQANFLGGEPYNGAETGPALGRAAPVGSYPANAWGLHDMHGNVFEWCRDWRHPALPGGVDPDLSDRPARSRSRRGGCFADVGWPCRSAFRLAFEPERSSDHIGFRVVAVRQ